MTQPDLSWFASHFVKNLATTAAAHARYYLVILDLLLCSEKLGQKRQVALDLLARLH